LLPLRYKNDRARMAAVLPAVSTRQELWWLPLLGVVVLLCAEVLLTRPMAKGR
jgi:hypothetical protein